MIREALSGKRLMLTGVTGFLGTALFERLLTEVPVDRLDLVIRGDGPQKLSWLLAGSAFGPARERLGPKLDKLVKQKVRVVSADLAKAPPAIDDDIDLVIHSAAAVSFDPPMDEAFATNLMGTTRLYEAAGGRPFIHVSTAYVAGITHGTQHEELLNRNIDWRAEAEAATKVGAAAQAESRRPEVLERLASRARAELGRAGPQTVAVRTEQLRLEWLKERLVRSGTERARSLGWPDVYTFTKALTELALDELAGDNPLAIVRPSIIESAVERPFPGWIEGFRMADPVMLAYGRGALPDFPGIPEGVLDIIPVDLVVNCLMAVASKPLPRRSVYHVCSGDRNPLQCRELYKITRNYFLANPLPERDRGSYRVPEWTFPGRPALDKKLRIAGKVLEGADRVVARIPRGPLARQTARRVDRLRRQYDFLKRYSELYGSYIEAEVVYTDSKAKDLHESLTPQDRRDFGFDPSAFTWQNYLGELHLPMLTSPLRWISPTRPEPAVNIGNGNGRTTTGDGQDPRKVIAAFDIEGTILASNVLESYVWLRLADMDDPVRRAAIAASIAARVPSFVKAERRDRGYFLRMFYRQYGGLSADALRGLAASCLPDLLFSKLAPGATRRIREHRRAGHHIVLITGSLDFIAHPLAALADELVATRLKEADGFFTGDLQSPPLVGEARASWLKDRADALGADLSVSYSYADSMSDLPMLEAVGNPVAVNPDVALARIARTRKWPVEEWSPEKGVPKIRIPDTAAYDPVGAPLSAGRISSLFCRVIQNERLFTDVPLDSQVSGRQSRGRKSSRLLAGPVAPIRLIDRGEPRLPGPGWTRVRPLLAGICGSDLSAISGATSFYFSALVSMPFTPGHEVVGELAQDADGLAAGQRVVIDPVLGCVPRGIDPACGPCSSGQAGLCERFTGGHVSAGLQTGYCSATSGGWSHMLAAHSSQLHPVPADMADESAVMVEPMACAIRSVRRAAIPRDAHVLIVGAGTVGLLTLLAVRKLSEAARITICAKHPKQVALARHFGATDIYSPDETLGAVRRSTGAFKLNPERSAPFLLGGVDVAFECVGSGSSLDLALRVTKAGGKVVLSGMPQKADLSPAWFRELEVVGSYSGTGAFGDALELAAEFELGKLVGPSYPLARWREALDHALSAGSLGATKIAFDPRLDN